METEIIRLNLNNQDNNCIIEKEADDQLGLIDRTTGKSVDRIIGKSGDETAPKATVKPGDETTEKPDDGIAEKAINETAKKAGEILKNGGIAAFPTDTVYGLGAVFNDAEAVRKIFIAKGRPENKPLSILVSDIEEVELLAEEISEDALKLMKAFWPGALTLIFKKKAAANIPDEVTAGGDTIGIRMPDNEFTRKIIRKAGSPLAAPSANTSGKRSAATGEEVIEDLDKKVDMIIDAGGCSVGVSSTVLDMTGDKYKILRLGTITEDMLNEVLK